MRSLNTAIVLFSLIVRCSTGDSISELRRLPQNPLTPSMVAS